MTMLRISTSASRESFSKGFLSVVVREVLTCDLKYLTEVNPPHSTVLPLRNSVEYPRFYPTRIKEAK
jgi:hypothetical protein